MCLKSVGRRFGAGAIMEIFTERVLKFGNFVQNQRLHIG